jgi:hypothetical protein
MGQIPHEGLVMAERQTAPKTCAIQCEMWHSMIWNKVEINMGIHLQNLLSENNPKSKHRDFSNWLRTPWCKENCLYITPLKICVHFG